MKDKKTVYLRCYKCLSNYILIFGEPLSGICPICGNDPKLKELHEMRAMYIKKLANK